MSWGSPYTGDYLVVSLSATEICSRDYADGSALVRRGNQACVNIVGHSDIVVRIQRIGSLPTDYTGSVGSFWLEAQDVDGTQLPHYCISGQPNNTTGCPMSANNPSNWTAHAGWLGDPLYKTSSFSLAWLKWFSTTVTPGSPFSQETTPADLADFRFENSLANQGTGGYGVTIGSFNKGPSYNASPTHRPACILGSSRTFRAGFPAQLDGTNSYSLNGNPSLSYLWQELSGPTNVQWAGNSTARPSVSQTVFGSYVFQLTVSDSGGQSSKCTVKDGFVATDSNDVVITGQSGVDTLLGPMVRYGANPWPWADDRHKAEADMQRGQLDTYFSAFWDTPAPGTIAVTAGSAVVTGVGTSFTTTFCQGPGSPTTLKSGGPEIVVWYPNSSPAGHGTRSMIVSSCQSDTQVTMSVPWATDVADCHSGGCPYAFGSGTLDTVWKDNSAPANFYDAVAAFYAMYYRTGLDDYLVAARTLADRFWTYELDSGTICAGNDGKGGCIYSQRWAPRNMSMLGMVLRALDGRPDMWPGIRTIAKFYASYYLLSADPAWGLWDIREEAYHMATVAYDAMFDPDATSRAGSKTALSYAMDHLWKKTQSPDGSWQQMYYAYNSWTSKPTTVALINGSNLITGNGTSWTSGVNGRRIVFTASSQMPANRQAQESTYYTITYVDGTHIILDRPYQGTTGTHGWIIGTTQATGWGVQPFIEGILGLAFGFTAEAIADSDATNAAQARNYVTAIANWQRTYGFRGAVDGMQYFAGTVDCMPPIPETSTWCTAGNNPSQARTLNAETLRSVMLAYSYTRDSDLLAFGDTLYNAMFGKPGTCPANSSLCLPDGNYVSDLNDVWGYYMSGTPPAGRAHKWFGMFFGIGAAADWPAFRLGATRQAFERRVYKSPPDRPIRPVVETVASHPE
jgi:hypothetical protein